MADNSNGASQPADGKPGQQFAIQKIYLKDCSFEAPGAPDVFRQPWNPKVGVELDVRQKELGDNHYEVVVQVTVTAKADDKTLYLCEVQQAGVFAISGVEPAMLKTLLGSYCPATLFPYAREAVTALTGKGGFPPMTLAPVNFDVLYAQQQARRQQQQSGAESG
jgi:preprotein translocase subunit SecB